MAIRETGVNLVADFDPSGSIFLPQTSLPEVEFERWRQQIVFERGVFGGKNLTNADKDRLLEELVRVRSVYLGAAAERAVLIAM